MKIELTRFTEDLLPAGSKLLAERHKNDRRILPQLPARFDDAAIASKAIETLLANKTATGFAAIHDGKLAAYLIGETVTQAWGRCGYVYLPGSALASGSKMWPIAWRRRLIPPLRGREIARLLGATESSRVTSDQFNTIPSFVIDISFPQF